MSKYICSNCGNVQYSYGKNEGNSGCAQTFWVLCLVITILISLFCPVAWVVVLFEILFIILTSPKNHKINTCNKCNATNCVIPIDTPRGEEIYNQFYKKKDEIVENIEENVNSENPAEVEKDKTTDEKIIEYFEENQEQYMPILKVAVFVIIVIFFLGLINADTTNQPQEKNTVKQKVQKTEAKEEKQTKTENVCKELREEISLFNDRHFSLPDSEFITKTNTYFAQCETDREKHQYLSAYYLGKANRLKAANDFENSTTYYKKAIEEEKLRPKDTNPKKVNWTMVDVYNGYIADNYYNSSQWYEAAQYYEKAMERGYANKPFSAKVCESYYNGGYYEEAYIACQNAVETLANARIEIINEGRAETDSKLLQEFENLESICYKNYASIANSLN